jgi:SAM-dependent methyltransferase
VSSTVSSTWFQDFFTELPNEFWRQAFPAGAAEAEIEFAEQRLGLAAGAHVLDLPCGSGRHSIALARRGYRVTGFDISTEAVAYAVQAAAGLDVELRVADMRALPPVSADAAVCLGNSFGYFEVAGMRAVAASLAGAVRPGGGVLLDINTAAESLLPGYRSEPRRMVAGDVVMTGTTEYDAARSRLFSHYRFSRGDESVEVTAIHHVYTAAHLASLLSEAGFSDLQLYGDLSGRPYAVGDGRLLITGRRV